MRIPQTGGGGIPWTRYCALLGALFVARGLLLLCFFPPLEGPDEYQHVANAVYVLEQGERPRFRKAKVPRSLYPDIVANPHSFYDWRQTSRIGALRYEEFYTHAPVVAGERPLGLYQAQHPPLYYRLAAPIFGALKRAGGFRVAMYLMRVINIILAAAALVMLLLPLRLIFGDTRRGRMAALAISLLPMLLVYVCRVSNDALALFFTGASVLVLSTLPRSRRPVLVAAAAGISIAAGVWSRMSAFSLLPAALAWIAVLGFRRRLSRNLALWSGTALAACYLLTAGAYHVTGQIEEGTFFPAADAVGVVRANATVRDLVGHAKARDIVELGVNRFVMMNLWTSGWSFLEPRPLWKWCYGAFLALAAGGAAAAGLGRVLRRSADRHEGDAPAWIAFSALFAFSNLSLVYVHALFNRVVHGQVFTPSYYSMPGFPSLLALAFAAVGAYRLPAVWNIGAALCATTFFLTEWHSVLFVALPHWTATQDVAMMMERSGRTHPYFFSPQAVPGFAVAVVSLLCASVAGISSRGGITRRGAESCSDRPVEPAR